MKNYILFRKENLLIVFLFLFSILINQHYGNRGLFPLDSFSAKNGNFSVYRMEVDNKPDELTEAHKEFIEVVKKVSGENWKVGSISRQNFYQEAKKSYCIVTTTDTRPFGCFFSL